MFEIV
jgi:hypothetical protein